MYKIMLTAAVGCCVSKLLRVLTYVHHYRLPIVGLSGLVMTIALSNPGSNMGTLGPLRFDMFYFSIAVCGSLILSISVLDKYNPEDYGLKPTDSEK